METMQQMDQERSIWRMMPLHPQPQWLKSLSSYIIRLAEANGLKSMNELAILSGIWGWEQVRLFPDYAAFSAERLACISGCTRATLRDTTFYHLARHFACSTLSGAGMRDFFQGSIAASLRYCPLCMAEMPYYRLCWRFLAIAGCHKHGCHLLNECGHCGTPVPFLPYVPRIAFCTTCQGDLRTCPAPLLPQQAERKRLRRRAQDLELLLVPTEWAPEITPAILQGSGFTFLRQRKHLSVTEVASLMQRDEQIIQEIEQGNWNGNTTLADYWQYTEILECSLSEVIEAAQIMRISEHERRLSRLDEIALLVRMEAAQDLRRSRAERSQETNEPIRPLRRKNRVSTSKS